MARKSISEQIKEVLRKYFEYHDNGNKNEEFDETFSAADALDEIHYIVGDI